MSERARQHRGQARRRPGPATISPRPVEAAARGKRPTPTPTPAADTAWPLFLWFAGSALLAWSFGFTRMLNSDLWFHLAAGRTIVEQRSIPRVDSWSFTVSGQPWHNHEWLSDVVFYLWSQAFGTESLVVWQWALLVAAALLLFDLMRQRCGPAHSWLILLFALATAAPFFDIRPHAWSFFLFALLLRLTLASRPRPRLVPLLFLPWSNLHAGFVFGLMAFALIVVAHLLPRQGSAERRWQLAAEGPLLLAAAVAASLVNPFGWRALLYPLQMAWHSDSPSRTTLVEWVSPFRGGGIVSPLYVPGLVLVVVSLVVLAARGRLRQHPRTLAVLGLTLLTAAMSATSRRFIELFAIAAALLFAEVMPPGKWAQGRIGLVTACLALGFGLVRLQPYPLGRAAFVPLTVSERMPEDEIGFALANGLAGNVFCYFQWGGYVDWRTDGRLRVFIDPRSETVFPPTVQRLYRRVAHQQPGWQQVIEGSQADFVLWPFAPPRQRRLVESLLASRRWKIAHTGAQGVLLARAGLELPPPQPSPASPARSWGLARRALGEGDLDRAEAHLLHALRQPPALPSACAELAVVQRRLGKDEEAESTEAQCARIFPS